MNNKQIEQEIRKTRWQYRTNSFSVLDYEFAEVLPDHVNGRRTSALMVKYPEGGFSFCNERWTGTGRNKQVSFEIKPLNEWLTFEDIHARSFAVKQAAPSSGVVYVPASEQRDRIHSEMKSRANEKNIVEATYAMIGLWSGLPGYTVKARVKELLKQKRLSGKPARGKVTVYIVH